MSWLFIYVYLWLTSEPSRPGMRSGTRTWWRKMSCRSWRRGQTLTAISPARSTCVNSTTEQVTTSKTCCCPATTEAWSAVLKTSKWWVRRVNSWISSAGPAEACQDDGQHWYSLFNNSIIWPLLSSSRSVFSSTGWEPLCTLWLTLRPRATEFTSYYDDTLYVQLCSKAPALALVW